MEFWKQGSDIRLIRGIFGAKSDSEHLIFDLDPISVGNGRRSESRHESDPITRRKGDSVQTEQGAEIARMANPSIGTRTHDGVVWLQEQRPGVAFPQCENRPQPKTDSQGAAGYTAPGKGRHAGE